MQTERTETLCTWIINDVDFCSAAKNASTPVKCSMYGVIGVENEGKEEIMSLKASGI